MGYRERPAPPGLGLSVTWEQAIAPGEAPHVQRVVPDGQIDLIWFAHEGEVQVAGPDTGPQFAEVPPGGRLVGVRFRPGLASPALGVPADAVRDGRVPLRDLWGPDADALAARLAEADIAQNALTAHLAEDHDPQAALATDDPRAALATDDPGAILAAATGSAQAVLVAAVADRIRRATPADPIVPALVTGAGSVKETAARLGVSERQLRRRSLAAFGYGPKTLHRILRFQRALSLYRAGRAAADVAYEAGYSDQAHLSHEVRDLAGVPLSALR